MKKLLSALVSLALLSALAAVPASAAYSDVTGSLAAEVEKAVDYGLMNGYSADTFGYSDPMTRAQFAVVLVRMMGWETVSPQTPTFSDVPAGHTWYATVETAGGPRRGGRRRGLPALGPHHPWRNGRDAGPGLGLKSAAALAREVRQPALHRCDGREGVHLRCL